MIIRALNANHDWTFGKGKNDFIRDQKAVIENIDTRLLSFFRDCFFDPNAGIDWFRLMGTKSTQEEIKLSVRRVILQSYGVVRVNDISVGLIDRAITLTYNIDSIFTTQFSQNLEVMPNVS
jgi:hypothetical protein